MDEQEFNTLMNNAYKFLEVECPSQVSRGIFTETDQDRDGLITYVEYFKVIDKYICRPVGKSKEQPKEQPKPVVKREEPERKSRLRNLIWGALWKLYDTYVSGRHLSPNDN